MSVPCIRLLVALCWLFLGVPGHGAVYRVGLQTFGFDYSEESVLLFESYPYPLPYNSTAHSSSVVPNSQNVTAPLIAASVSDCRILPPSVNGSIILLKYSQWWKCHTIGPHVLYQTRQLASFNVSGIVIEINQPLSQWIPTATIYFLEGVSVPVLWVYTGIGNVSQVLDEVVALGLSATITPPQSDTLFASVDQVATVSALTQRLLIPLWSLVFVGTLLTLILRLRVERSIEHNVADTSMLRLALFFVLLLCLSRIVGKIDPAGTYGLLTRTWALSGNVLLMGCCLSSLTICVAGWWAMIVSLQSKHSKVQPRTFYVVVTIILILVWIIGIINFVIDSFTIIVQIWATLSALIVVLCTIASFVFGTIFLHRIIRSNSRKATRNALSKKSTVCCGMVKLTHLDLIFLRMGSLLLAILISVFAFVPIFILVAIPVLAHVLGFFLYDILGILISVFLNVMVFAAPKKQRSTRRYRKSSNTTQTQTPAPIAPVRAVRFPTTPRSEAVVTRIIVDDEV